MEHLVRNYLRNLPALLSWDRLSQ